MFYVNFSLKGHFMCNINNLKKHNKGFTFIELSLVMFIVMTLTIGIYAIGGNMQGKNNDNYSNTNSQSHPDSQFKHLIR